MSDCTLGLKVSWLRNKLLPVANSANAKDAGHLPVIPAYLLDATGMLAMTNALPILMSHFPDLGNWEANIQNNAERIVQGKHRRTRSVRPALTMILRFPFKTGIT